MRLVVWAGGLLLGIAAGAAVLYFNPLTRGSGTVLESTSETQLLHYSTGGPGALAFTHGTPLDLPVYPSGTPTLFESALAKTALGLYVLEDASGHPVALASRVSKLSPLTNPLTTGLVLADQWLVTTPGSGTFFIGSESNLWPLLRDTVIDVGLLRRAWFEPRDYRVTIGPVFGRAGIVVGASGRYRDMTGTAIDTLRLDGFSNLARLREPLEGSLEIDLQNPAAESGAEDDLNVAQESP